MSWHLGNVFNRWSSSEKILPPTYFLIDPVTMHSYVCKRRVNWNLGVLFTFCNNNKTLQSSLQWRMNRECMITVSTQLLFQFRFSKNVSRPHFRQPRQPGTNTIKLCLLILNCHKITARFWCIILDTKWVCNCKFAPSRWKCPNP